jgi:hypothetical protein
MKVAEVPGAALFFVEVAEGDVQTHGPVTKPG